MRIFHHISLFTVLLLSFSYAAVAQSKVSDTKLEGLKGQVKSLVSTSKSISGYADWVLKDKTKYQTTYLFNREGELTKSIHEGGSHTRHLYSKIDGYKTSKTVELKSREDDGNRFTVLGSKEKEEPIEPNEKLTEPDKRFDFRYAYETDSSGRIVSERQYQNNGRLFRKRTFEYSKAGVLTKETEEDSIARMTYSFTYDEGNVVEVKKTRDIKGAGNDSKERITYTEFKFDSVGNWTERKTTSHSETDPMPQYKIPAKTYTLVDVEFRTLTYY